MRSVNSITISLLVICCSSCSRYYYKPNAVNAPLLTAPGQVHVAGSIDNSSDGPSVDMQGAWSPVNHLGIIANFSNFQHSQNNPDAQLGQVDAVARFAEAGAGYYYAYGSKKISLVLDAYGGPGIGYLKSDINSDFARLFIQPGVGVRTYFAELVFNWRLSGIHYFDLNTNGHDDAYLQQQDLLTASGRRIDNGSYVFSEPSVTFRAGYKMLKFQVQYVWANSLSNVPWNYNTSLLSIGLSFKLEEAKDMFRKKRPTETTEGK